MTHSNESIRITDIVAKFYKIALATEHLISVAYSILHCQSTWKELPVELKLKHCNILYSNMSRIV